MKTLQLEQNPSRGDEGFGPDPLLQRKQGLKNSLSRDLLGYKDKIEDAGYMRYAIDKIAMELMHFLVK